MNGDILNADAVLCAALRSKNTLGNALHSLFRDELKT